MVSVAQDVRSSPIALAAALQFCLPASAAAAVPKAQRAAALTAAVTCSHAALITVLITHPNTQTMCMHRFQALLQCVP